MDEPWLLNETEPTEKPRRRLPVLLLIGFVGIGVLVAVVLYVLTRNDPPHNFPTTTEIRIAEGSSITDIAEAFQQENVVRSSLYFKVILKYQFAGAHVQAGSYQFTEPLSSVEIARAITSGEYHTPPMVLTFPEGFRIRNLAKYVPEQLLEEDFEQYEVYEGYLFPDTYFFDEEATLEEVVARMRETFNQKIQPLENRIENSALSVEEIVTLASLLEREAQDEESKRIVAGILLSRLEIGMALQVDAVFEYLLGKRSDELTEDDLELDSPYNTYTNRGLPPTPIANPGLTAIEAVLNPIETKYLYYLTDEDGVFHYAETFEKHKENKSRYLK